MTPSIKSMALHVVIHHIHLDNVKSPQKHFINATTWWHYLISQYFYSNTLISILSVTICTLTKYEYIYGEDDSEGTDETIIRTGERSGGFRKLHHFTVMQPFKTKRQQLCHMTI